MRVTRDSRSNLDSSQIGQFRASALNDASKRMIRTRSTPRNCRGIMYDITRADRRRNDILGAYTKVAMSLAAAGAPADEVLAPMRELEGILRTEFYSKKLPKLADVQQMETDAQARLDKLQLQLGKDPDIHVVAETRERVQANIEALKTLLEVLDGLYFNARHKNAS